MHKGTPYYWLGVTAILNDDFDKGFLYMHNAFEEDQQTKGTLLPNSPAHFFVTLEANNVNQAFRPKVEYISNYLESKITQYNIDRGRSLSLEDFKREWLTNPDLLDVVYDFVYLLFKFNRMEVQRELTHNTFGTLLMTTMLFELCRIVEVSLRTLDPSIRIKNFGSDLEYYFEINNISIPHLPDVNANFNSNFQTALLEILRPHSDFFGYLPEEYLQDLVLAYRFRNFCGHSIDTLPEVNQHFEDILQRILNALFYVVDASYLNYFKLFEI